MFLTVTPECKMSYLIEHFFFGLLMELYLIIIFLDALEGSMLTCTVPFQDQAFFSPILLFLHIHNVL